LTATELPGDRRRPAPTEMTQPFWDAARLGTLVRSVCDSGHNFFPPQRVCPICLSSRWTYVPSSGRGTVYSHTTIHRAPGPGFVVPYVLAMIDVEEGWTILANVVNCEPASVRIGLAVRVTWQRAEDGFALPAFECAPAESLVA
jgi:uncharacterized OB-fold protein